MCDGGLILGLVSTAVGAAGAIQQASAASQAAKYNAKVADMNAQISERRARDAIERGKEAEQQKRYQVAQIAGKQRAAMAANGVDIGFGSPLDTLIDTATLGELDALTIRRNSANEAYDYKVQAANGRAEAGLQRANAQNSMTAGYLGAFGTVLGGAGDAWKSYQKSRIGAIA